MASFLPVTGLLLPHYGAMPGNRCPALPAMPLLLPLLLLPAMLLLLLLLPLLLLLLPLR